MATDGQNSKPKKTLQDWKTEREAKAKRYAEASLKQKVNWRRFRINGAAGFADGALGSAINRLNALSAEFPISHQANRQVIVLLQSTLRAVRKDIAQLRITAHNSAEIAEIEWSGNDATNNCSGS